MQDSRKPGDGGPKKTSARLPEPKPVSDSLPIVSSAHLAAGESPALSEVEYGLILAGHGFSRWMTRCMGAAGWPGFSPLEILVLHTTKHRDRPKRLADICLVLDIEDTHLATYAICSAARRSWPQNSGRARDTMTRPPNSRPMRFNCS